ncbi:MAG: glycine--tRNA ligase subunit beta, partial [Chloroflexi bacterium]|nr:glycine--tRNA ligase subunit beta [Chloroflexota bacterium]
YVLKCNHIFNVLDARGAVGVTERAQFFRTMHGMTRACASAYLVEREALGFPWREKLKEQWPAVVAPERVSDEVVETGDFESFLLEIGVEEMPPEHIREVEKQLNTQQNFSPLSSFEIFITPRRIVLYVGHVLLSNLGAIKEFRGPPAKIALDDQGKPTTAAALGFARSKGVTTDDLYSKQEEGGEYIFALVKRPFLEVLAEHVNELLKKLKFSRTMRWNDTGFEFSRPIRWLVALWKDQVVPLKLAGLEADRFTKGHRREGSPLVKLSSASEYLEQMRKCEIQLNKVERQQRVKELLLSELNPNGEKIVEDDELLEEVSSLVENPTVLRCEFDEQFLQLPDVVRTTVMKKHQRYFPIRNVLDYMQPSFLVVCDGAGDEQIRRGYEQVLAARFADTQFFYEQDRKQSLEDFLPRLDTMTFHEKLGSMRDKSQRLEQLVKWLAEEVLGFDTDVIKVAEQAARLCKADLATQMVVELTSLQGEMGRIYAREDGIAEEVAQAIYEHWLPRHADDTLPESKPGILLALADRLDSLVGLMGVGWEATGSSDPYGLRRAARGVIRLLIEKNIDVSFSDICNIARFFPPSADITKLIEEVLEFLKERLYFRLVELTPGLEIDEFDSGLYTVGGEGGSMTEMHRLNAPRAIMNMDENSVRPWRAAKRLEKFVPWVVSNDKWAQILNGYERCARISRDAEEIPIQASLFKEAAEVALYREYLQAREEVDQEKDVDALLGAMEAMLPAITRFFDEILVMSEEEHIRRNRLALLQGISNLPNGIVDLRAMFRN